MRHKLIHEAAGQRTFAAVLEIGDEAMSFLQQLAQIERLSAAQISAIGAFRSAAVAFFDWERREYQRIPVEEQVEVVALTGDISTGEKGEPKVHAHAVLGRRDGATLGGHLMEGHVRPTLEIIITESPAHLRRVHDARSGLALIDLEKTGR
jgi:uncharacterized protein